MGWICLATSLKDSSSYILERVAGGTHCLLAAIWVGSPSGRIKVSDEKAFLEGIISDFEHEISGEKQESVLFVERLRHDGRPSLHTGVKSAGWRW